MLILFKLLIEISNNSIAISKILKWQYIKFIYNENFFKVYIVIKLQSRNASLHMLSAIVTHTKANKIFVI